MKNFKTINVAVCQGRHDIPQATDGAIFGAIHRNESKEAINTSTRCLKKRL